MLQSFEKLIEAIENAEVPIIKDDFDFILVLGEEAGIYRGINFKANGADYSIWTCPSMIQSFKINNVYILNSSNEYCRISPFINLTEEGDSFIFSSIDEKLTGRTRYNQLLKTGVLFIDLKEFADIVITQDRYKKKSSNGTIINVFNNNYKQYIEIGITKSIIDFLVKSKSSVFATLWGHGGVGKTASIQNVCDILCRKENKDFDYILFLSAKDRLYNYYKGKIEDIEENISTLEQIIKYSNKILYNDESDDEQKILDFEGKILFIIDDFETFVKVEKEKVTNFIKKLDINRHKVIITTRAAILITGEEIRTAELNIDETINFLQKAIEVELSLNISEVFARELKKRSFQEKIFEITSGRPLFILQFAILLAQKSSVEEALLYEINQSSEAKNFLYNRIYDYLSLGAKNLFLAISLLVSEDDLSGLLENLKFLVNREDFEEEFQIDLNELIKLKIITVEDKFFRVYSPEVFRIMKEYYQNKGEEYDGNITSRFNLINNERNLGTEVALLENADSSRLLSSEVEVENNYRYILKRDKAPVEIKLKALINFSTYLINSKGKINKALKVMSDYSHVFSRSPEYIKKYSAALWSENSNENRYLAIDVITNYFKSKPLIETEIYLELLGTLMTYASILLVNERDELKIKNRYNEISKSEADILYKEQRERFNEIYNYPGLRLYKIIKDVDFKLLSPNCRNYVLDGLTHFVEVCIRTNKWEIGKQICNKVFNELSENYHKPFVFKLSKIESLENPHQKINPYRIIGESDLSVRLKEAFNK